MPEEFISLDHQTSFEMLIDNSQPVQLPGNAWKNRVDPKKPDELLRQRKLQDIINTAREFAARKRPPPDEMIHLDFFKVRRIAAGSASITSGLLETVGHLKKVVDKDSITSEIDSNEAYAELLLKKLIKVLKDKRQEAFDGLIEICTRQSC